MSRPTTRQVSKERLERERSRVWETELRAIQANALEIICADMPRLGDGVAEEGAPAPAVPNPFVAALVPPVISGAPNENVGHQFNMFDRFCQCLDLHDDRKV